MGMTENFLWSPGAFGFGAGTEDLLLGVSGWGWGRLLLLPLGSAPGFGMLQKTGRDWDGPGHEAEGL